MSDRDIEAGVGRLAMKYDRINRRIACLRDRLSEHGDALNGVCGAINLLNQGQHNKAHEACSRVDWDQICKDAEQFPKLIEEKRTLENCLREAGLDRLILPEWK